MLWKRLPGRTEIAVKYANDFGVNPLTAQMLINRGVTDAATMERFLNPRLDRLHDPFQMKGMERAVRRIRRAIIEGERINIHGDYDVDGVSSTALLLIALRRLGANVHYHVVTRGDSTVGLSVESMHRDHLPDKPDLIITADCGTTNVEAIQIAADNNIDVIVVDHHQPGAKLPKPYALLNPCQPGCPFPFKKLAAVGVAYHLVIALDRFLKSDGDDWPRLPLASYADIVALGTVADVVPLIDANRVFVREGLRLIHTARRPGICALMRSARLINEYQGGVPAPITTRTIGFRLAPLINAAGRMGDARRCVELLATDSYRVAVQVAGELVKYNTERQKCEKAVLADAVAMSKEVEQATAPLLVLASEGWHPGVLGIVASRLVERTNKPAVVANIDEYGYARGSVRAPSGVNMLKILDQCGDLLEEWGGHPAAAGLQFHAHRLTELRARANEQLIAQAGAEGRPERELRVDATINLSELNHDLFREFDILAPFGIGNPEPILEVRGVSMHKPRIRGANVKAQFRQGSNTIHAMGFGLASRLNSLSGAVDIVFSPRRNSDVDSQRVEVYLKDIRAHRAG